jgi:6-phosphofructo-2-kinase/fructose-2,6-biphosphatase 4
MGIAMVFFWLGIKFLGMKVEDLIKEYGFNLLDSHEKSRSFRYPSGESYNDLVMRLEPFIMEVMRIKDPVIIIAHPSIVRCLYGFLSPADIANIPAIKVPKFQMYKYHPSGAGYAETRYFLD